jgi:hypothetical protein
MAPPSDDKDTAESNGGAYHKYSSPTNNNSNNKQEGRSFSTKQPGHGRRGGGIDGDDETNVTGRRSIIDNISLPYAFHSAYSASRKVEDGKASRASYRNP